MKYRRTLAAVVASIVVVIPAAASAATTTSALYNFDETSGTSLKDTSGNNLNGTFGSGVQLGQPGYSGTAYGFTTGRVTVPSNSKLNPGTRNFHFTVRIKTSTAPGSSADYDLIRKGLSTSSGGDYKAEILPVSGKGIAYCEFKSGSTTASISSSSSRNLTDGAWHQITCSKTATSISVTVDGTKSSKNAGLGSISNTASLTIGAKSNGDDQYHGLLDDAGVYLD